MHFLAPCTRRFAAGFNEVLELIDCRANATLDDTESICEVLDRVVGFGSPVDASDGSCAPFSQIEPVGTELASLHLTPPYRVIDMRHLSTYWRNAVPHDAHGSPRHLLRTWSMGRAAVAAGLAVVLLTACQPDPADRQDAGFPPDPGAPLVEQPADQPVATADTDAAPTGRAPSLSDAGAYAELQPVPGQEARGTVEFATAPAGVHVHARLTGLAPGSYGFHVHEVGDCTDPGETAGGHFSPQDNPHGSPLAPPAARHAGDLGNVVADATGDAELRVEMAGLEVDGERGVVGRSVVLHEGEDDFETQPDGDAGDPVACGVIHAAATP